MAARRVTLADVADATDVSVGTVSKALNGRGQLSESTRRRVLDAAADLGFRPNQDARSLATGRSFIVGVLSTDSYGRFTIPILTGA
ncbi:MAG: LacI family DNA-binding transcriptional regulator, partial [Actinomycetes bacterium]